MGLFPKKTNPDVIFLSGGLWSLLTPTALQRLERAFFVALAPIKPPEGQTNALRSIADSSADNLQNRRKTPGYLT